jgi:hypothetical protein
LPLLLATTLVVTHNFQFGLGLAAVFLPLLHQNDQRLLLRKPPLTTNYVAFQLPQFIQKWLIEHHPKHRLEERPQLGLQVAAPAHTPMCRGRWRSLGSMSSPRDG